MKNEFIDAVETAKSIHDGDYSSLHGKSFVIIDNNDKIKKKGDHHSGDKPVRTSRLDRIEESITKLTKTVEDGFKRVNSRIDNLEKDVNSLKQDVKDINARIDRIDARLDYNGLKRLPSNN